MAEKGILMTDQAGGTSIACIDANEVDGDSNARLIPRISLVRGLAASHSSPPIRSGITAADASYDLDALPAQLLANLIDTEDKSTLVVSATMETTLGSPAIRILPILFDSNDYAYAIGEPFLFNYNIDGSQFINPAGTWMTSLHYADINNNEYHCGACKTGLFILNASNIDIEIKVWGSMI